MSTSDIIETAATEISAYLVGVRTAMIAVGTPPDQPVNNTLNAEVVAVMSLVQASAWADVQTKGAVSGATASALVAVAVDDPAIARRALGLLVLDRVGVKFRAAVGTPEPESR